MRDAEGVTRFKANAIVRHLVDKAGRELFGFGYQDYSVEDREQLAQLMGYSVDRFGELGDVRPETLAAVEAAERGETTPEAERIGALEASLARLRDGMRDAVAELYGLHPDALERD